MYCYDSDDICGGHNAISMYEVLDTSSTSKPNPSALAPWVIIVSVVIPVAIIGISLYLYKSRRNRIYMNIPVEDLVPLAESINPDVSLRLPIATVNELEMSEVNMIVTIPMVDTHDVPTANVVVA
jgi:hypothetical protein